MSEDNGALAVLEDLNEDEREALKELARERAGRGEATRREFGKAALLGALGLGGVTGAGAGVAAAQESSTQEVGQIGTDSKRVDVYGDTVFANELVGVDSGSSIFSDDDGDGIYEQTTGSGISTDEAVIGVDPADGPGAVEQAVSDLPAGGGTVQIRRGAATWTDRAYITRDNVTVELSPGTEISVNDGNWTAVPLDPASAIPDKKAVFVFDGCTNSRLVGGHIDGSGFEYTDGDGEDACGVLFLNCQDGGVEDITVTDVWPDAFADWGSETDSSGEELRYNGVLVMKSAGVTVEDCVAEGIKYDAFAARVACEDVTFKTCTARASYEGFQSTVRYGQADADSADDQYCRQTGYDNCKASDCNQGFVSHCTGATIDSPRARDCTIGVNLRVNGGHTMVSGGSIRNESEGIAGITVDGGGLTSISGVTIQNFAHGVRVVGWDTKRVNVQGCTIASCDIGFENRESSSAGESYCVLSGNTFYGGTNRVTAGFLLAGVGDSVTGNMLQVNQGGDVGIDADRDSDGTPVSTVTGNYIEGFDSNLNLGSADVETSGNQLN